MASTIIRDENGEIIRVVLDNTRFIFMTNLQGDPSRDSYGSTDRCANVVIPDVEMAQDLIEEGFNVKVTKPKKGEEEGFVPEYFVKVRLKYKYNDQGLVPFNNRRQPKVYLVAGDSDPILCGPDNESEYPGVSIIDDARIDNVKVTLSPYRYNEMSNPTLYIQHLYAHQGMEDDPFYDDYRTSEDDLPFE